MKPLVALTRAARRNRAQLAAVGVACLAAGVTATRADAQLTASTTLKPPTVIKTPALAVTAADIAAIKAFKTGLAGKPNSVPSGSASPLVTVTLTWPAYPHATAYQVLRAAVAASGQPYAFIALPGNHLPPTVTSHTVIDLPPTDAATGWNGSAEFRIVAYANGVTDTTNTVFTALPGLPVAPDYMSPTNNWPPQSAAPFAGVGYRKCMDTGSSIALAWGRNPSAASYTVQLAQFQSNSTFATLPPISVTDTTLAPSLGAGAYRVYVRPEFAVPNWPVSGQTLTVHGTWSFLGTSHTPTPMSVPLPCPHY